MKLTGLVGVGGGGGCVKLTGLGGGGWGRVCEVDWFGEGSFPCALSLDETLVVIIILCVLVSVERAEGGGQEVQQL